MNLKKKLKKYKNLYDLLSWCRLFIFFIYYRLFMIIFSVIPIKRNKIMIINYAGKGFGDNGKYIVERLLLENKDVNIYWATSSKYKKTLPEKVNYTKFNSIIFLFHLSTSKIWISNSRLYYGIKKRKRQFYIQTWHSTLRLKKIEKDAIELFNKQLIVTCKSDSKMIDLIVSGSDFSTNTYRNSFWYEGDIENCGTPRCDILFDKKQKKVIKKKIYEKYEIDENKKIILYAPTFRKNTNEKDSYIDWKKIIDRVNDEYVVFVRMHPISKTIIENSDRIYNVTDYPDMQELISISNYLITDYSGCCFDMMLTGNPCILFTKDLDDYLSHERKLYFNFNELPFPNIQKENDLISLINNFDFKKYKENVAIFSKKVGICETGNASKRIVEIIMEVIKNEKI